MNKIIVAVDGFSSCGKSTMAKKLAIETGYIYVDSGAMYRAVSFFCIQNGWMTETGINEDELVKVQKENEQLKTRIKELEAQLHELTAALQKLLEKWGD